MIKCGFSTELKYVNRIKNPQELWDWCLQMQSRLKVDVSRYAKGRYRTWLFHEVDFRDGSISKAYFDQRIWDFSQRVYPGSDIALLTFGGTLKNGEFSDGRISPHRDHTYACAETRLVNLGESIFTYGEQVQKKYHLKDGQVVEFNCKVLHGLEKVISDQRFSLVFWKLNQEKGYKPLS